MKSRWIEEDEPIAEINIIPFVDIILVILIIFMVTAPFIIKTGFSLNLPKASSSETVDLSKINITISVDGKVFLNGEAFDLEQIKEHLKTQNIKVENTHAIISADKNVLHGKVIAVINAIKSVGLSKIAITTKRSH